MLSSEQMLAQLGAKPSESEENGLALIDDSVTHIFSPGISTAGFAEIRMVQNHPKRKVVATTLDEKGLQVAQKIIRELGLEKQIETRREDLRDPFSYSDEEFDFIYARLVLHYLSAKDLDAVLTEFHRVLQAGKKLFVVVRSTKSISPQTQSSFDPDTQLTSVQRFDPFRQTSYTETRYFHTRESIRHHLEKAGFEVQKVQEQHEQLYMGFLRELPSPIQDVVIEVLAEKPPR